MRLMRLGTKRILRGLANAVGYLIIIVDPEKWTRGLDRMPRYERGDRRGKKAI